MKFVFHRDFVAPRRLSYLYDDDFWFCWSRSRAAFASATLASSTPRGMSLIYRAGFPATTVYGATFWIDLANEVKLEMCAYLCDDTACTNYGSFANPYAWENDRISADPSSTTSVPDRSVLYEM